MKKSLKMLNTPLKIKQEEGMLIRNYESQIMNIRNTRSLLMRIEFNNLFLNKIDYFFDLLD